MNNNNQGILFPKPWVSKCFICGEIDKKPYNSSRLLCAKCNDKYKNEEPFKSISQPLDQCFITKIPELPEKTIKKILKSNCSDVLLPPLIKNDISNSKVLKNPFDSIKGLNTLKLNGLNIPCGQPAIHELDILQKFSGFKSVHSLDMSHFLWSGTLKDLKSWAVISMAIEKKIQNLVLWTAGNAGLSLAMLARQWNGRLSYLPESERKEKRINVYCLVDSTISREIVVNLRANECHVMPVASERGFVLLQGQIKNIFNALAEKKEKGKKLNKFWNVTDGWEGLGIFMYRILARQLITRFYKEKENLDYIIVPVGTGNLFMGFHLGNKDSKNKSVVIGAVPYGNNNIISPFNTDSTKETNNSIKRVEPIAPKLYGTYSPLSICLFKLFKSKQKLRHENNNLYFLEVDKAEQIEIGSLLLSQYIQNRKLALEPSALIPFGALRQLADKLKEEGCSIKDKNVLIVNSGLGIMGNDEEKFYHESIFGFH